MCVPGCQTYNHCEGSTSLLCLLVLPWKYNFAFPITMDPGPFVLQAKELLTSAPSATPSDDKLLSQCALPEYSIHPRYYIPFFVLSNSILFLIFYRNCVLHFWSPVVKWLQMIFLALRFLLRTSLLPLPQMLHQLLLLPKQLSLPRW